MPAREARQLRSVERGFEVINNLFLFVKVCLHVHDISRSPARTHRSLLTGIDLSERDVPDAA